MITSTSRVAKSRVAGSLRGVLVRYGARYECGRAGFTARRRSVSYVASSSAADALVRDVRKMRISEAYEVGGKRELATGEHHDVPRHQRTCSSF